MSTGHQIWHKAGVLSPNSYTLGMKESPSYSKINKHFLSPARLAINSQLINYFFQSGRDFTGKSGFIAVAAPDTLNSTQSRK